MQVLFVHKLTIFRPNLEQKLSLFVVVLLKFIVKVIKNLNKYWTKFALEVVAAAIIDLV